MSESTLFSPNLASQPLRTVVLTLLMALGLLWPAALPASDAKASRYYEDALQRFENKDLDGAIIQLKNALQIDPGMLAVQMLLGKALLQSSQVVAAEVALEQALALGVSRSEVVVPLAQAYLAQGKQQGVLTQPEFSITGLPADIRLQVWLLKAAASADLGDLGNALRAVEEAKAVDARSATPWLTEVPIRIRSKQFKEAQAALERALALAPQSPEAWYQKGAIAHASGDLAGTLAAYDKVLTLSPTHLETRLARAGLYLDLNRLPQAKAEIDELHRSAPKEPRATYLQALLAERNNQPEEARQALKELVGLIDPVPMDFIRYRPQLLMLNGLAHYGLNEPEKAKIFLEAFHKSQSNTPAAKLLARIYLKEASTERAIAVLETYLKEFPGDGQAMLLLGSALMTKGQHARAVALMQQALQAKDRPEFRTVLGLSLIRLGQTAPGVVELETAFKHDQYQTQAAATLAVLYLRSRQADKAVTAAEILVKQQPANAVFFNLLGMARGQTGKVAEARAAFERAVQLDAALLAPQLNLARLDISTQAYEAAAMRLGNILKNNEKNTEALFEMARLSDRRGQMAEAQRWLEKATDLSGPKETRWGLALADFHLRYGRPGPALEAVRRVAGKTPDDLTVLLAYARAQLANNDSVGAKSNLTTATRLAGYQPELQLEIARLQMAAKNPAGAAYSLDKALANQPDYLPALALMTEVALQQGDPAQAEKRARGIVASHPKQATGHTLLGDIALSRGQTAQALEAYRRAHQLEPSTESLLRLMGVLSVQDNGKAALPLAEQWVKSHPKDTIALKALANAYARSGQFAAARTTYETLLRLTPADSDALNNLANVLLRLKDPQAITVAEQAVAKNPGNASAIDTLGWALHQMGQYDRALQLLRDARLREPANPEIRYHLAVALARVGRRAEARDELDTALKSGLGLDSAAEARALLKTLNEGLGG